ncbi:MAG: DUF1761 domain-containing protein [Parcubacteria group bacterium]|nr:DUF1761 domain-containing protein [Parcubacteria group bacterium]
MPEVIINYWAILLCGITSIILGSLWYGPLFGKPWSKMMGYKIDPPEAMKEMQKKAMPGYLGSFVGALFMASVLTYSLVFASTYLRISGISAGLQTGFWNWLGFIVPVTVGSVFWEARPWKLWFINAGYWLVLLLVMGMILASIR